LAPTGPLAKLPTVLASARRLGAPQPKHRCRAPKFGGELALAALPIPWPVLLRASHHPRAGLLPLLPAAAAAVAAALPLNPRVAAALPSAALTVGQVRPAAEGLQQLLLLLVLLAQCIEQAAEVSIPASAVADARNASAAAATRHRAAHRRGGGMVPAEKRRRGRDA
jgi:hypothetical protein